MSLVSAEDRPLLRDIERLIGKKIEERVVPGFEPGSRHEQPQPQQPVEPPRHERKDKQQVPALFGHVGKKAG